MRLLGLCLLLITLVGILSSAKREERDTSGKQGRNFELVCKNISHELDVVFGIDASYTMRYGVNSGAKFATEVGQILLEKEKNKVGLFLYNDDDSKTSWKIHLTDKLNSEQLDEKLTNLGWEYQYGEDHGLAISTAIEEFVANKNPKTVRNIVLITDGQLESDKSAFKSLVEKALCQGYQIFAIKVKTEENGATSFANITGNQKNRIFDTTNPEKLLEAICDVPEPVEFNDKYWAPECDFPGRDFAKTKDPVQLNCEGICRKKPGCTHYAYSNYSGGTCFMKKGTVCPSEAYIKRDEFPYRACGLIPEKLNFM